MAIACASSTFAVIDRTSLRSIQSPGRPSAAGVLRFAAAIKKKKAPTSGRLLLGKIRLLTEVSAAIRATEPRSGLTGVAAGGGIPIIVTAIVAIIVGI
jgi:hypothetical protein